MTLKKLTKIEQQLAIKLYEEGSSLRTTAKKIGCSETTIFNLLKKNGIAARTKAGIYKIDYDSEKVIELYNSGKSAYEIQKIIGCKSVNTVYNFIRKHCNIRNGRHGKPWNNNVNIDFFKEPLSERAQYWLGYLFADGSVYQNKEKANPTISFEVSEKDGWIINEFKKDLNLDNKVQYIERRNRKYRRIQFTNKEISNDLIKYGITPGKTWHIQKFIGDEKTLTGHMLRGFMDGDGWTTLDTSGIRGVIGFVGNWYSMEIIKWVLGYKIGCNPDITIISNPEKNDWPRLSYSRLNDIAKLYDFMYKDATLYLERKKEKLDRLFKNRISKNLLSPLPSLLEIIE